MLTNRDIEKLKAVFATKDDLKAFATKEELKRELSALVKELMEYIQANTEALRQEFKHDIKTEIKKEVGKLRRELNYQFSLVRRDIAGIHSTLNDHETRIICLEQVTSQL